MHFEFYSTGAGDCSGGDSSSAAGSKVISVRARRVSHACHVSHQLHSQNPCILSLVPPCM